VFMFQNLVLVAMVMLVDFASSRLRARLV